MEYYSASRKKEVLPFATTQAKLEGVMLSQAEKDKNCMVSLLFGFYKSHTHRNRK